MAQAVQSHVRIEPTDAQLRAAWARVHRGTWPATFEAAMEDPLLGRVVRMNALHPPPPARHFTSEAPATPANAQPEPHHWQPPRGYCAPLPGFIDNKRRAAGERDDD